MIYYLRDYIQESVRHRNQPDAEEMIGLDKYLNEAVASGRNRNRDELKDLDQNHFDVKLFSDYLEQHGIPKFPESVSTDAGDLLWRVCDWGYFVYEFIHKGKHVNTIVKVMDPTEPIVYYAVIDAKTQKVDEVGQRTKFTPGKYREESLTWEEFLFAMKHIVQRNG